MHDMFVVFFFNLLQHCPELGSLVVAPCGEHAASPPIPSHSVCARQGSLQTRPRAFMNKPLNITHF